jgi:hypothetical protein
MDIVMTRNTLWQNLMIRIGEEFTVSDSIGTALIKRGVAKEKGKPEAVAPIVPKKHKEKVPA